MTDEDRAKAAIAALNREWETNFRNHDPAGLASLYTDDCVRMPNGGATTLGRKALEAAYRQEFADVWNMKSDVSIKTDDIVVMGDYAFARGTDTLTLEDSGKTVQETGKWMATYRREADGAWRYLWSTYNSNAPG